MNTTDLREVLEERSGDSAEHVMHHLRLHGVRAKVRRRRRQRVASWAACVVVALAAGVTAVAVLPGGSATPTPTAPRTIEGFPEYAQGARVVAAAATALPERTVEVTLTPSTLDLVVFTRCGDPDSGVSVNAQVTVNGHILTEGACTGAGRWDQDAWVDYGVTPGRPTTFVMTVTGAERFGGETNVPTALPATGPVALAIGERVPFADYPLPPRPAGTLNPLPAVDSDTLVIGSDPDDPTRPVHRTLAWQTLDDIHLTSQTPGLLHFRVNGVEIVTGEWWDYAGGGYGMYGDDGSRWKAQFGLDPRPGDQVTIDVVPEHLTGAWQVALRPAKTGR